VCSELLVIASRISRAEPDAIVVVLQAVVPALDAVISRRNEGERLDKCVAHVRIELSAE
jgi:hypothetical protein